MNTNDRYEQQKSYSRLYLKVILYFYCKLNLDYILTENKVQQSKNGKLMNEYAIGIDLGGTKIEMALVDQQGHATHSIKIPTNILGGHTAIANDISQIAEDLKKKANGNVFGIGIGAPGQIDIQDGSVLFAPNLKWNNVPIRKNLEQIIKLPVAITNDVRAATWGEWLHGAGKGSQDIVCLFIGTGIGSGIVSGGRMIQGFNNSAGELGHMVIQINGPVCTCGRNGCLEALASGWAIGKKAKELVQANLKEGATILSQAQESIENINAKHLIEAFLKKDPLAIKIMDSMYDALIIGCINIVNALNPEKLILGGGVVTELPEIAERIQKGINKHALKSASSKLQVMRAHLLKDAGAIGAGTLAWNTFKKTRSIDT